MRTYMVLEICGIPVQSLWFSLILFLFAAMLIAMDKWFGPLERGFTAVSKKRLMCVVGVGILALALRAAILPIVPPGEPELADEFAYLLAADTFTQGRLTNQPHPMWVHFETINQIQQPTHQSKYPVGQSLVLAVGQILGHPWLGVWLSCALMCAAFLWMLQGWLPPAWALIGALLVAVRFCTGHSWGTFYWGGAAAATAGALVMGALPRIMEQGRARHCIIMGLGLVLLANTRPFEGMVLGLGVGAVLLIWMIQQKFLSVAKIFLNVVLPIFLILAVGGAAMAYYFWKVTGDPFIMPYTVYSKTYDAEKTFIWQKPDYGKSYSHPDLEFFHHVQAKKVEARMKDYPFMLKTRAARIRFDCLAPGLFWMLLFVPFALKNKKYRILVFLGVVCLPAFMVTTYFYMHYLAPMLGLLYAIILVGMQRAWQWKIRGKKVGAALVRACIIAWVFMLGFQINNAFVFANKAESGDLAFRDRRAGIQKSLGADGNKHLIVVRYIPSRCRSCDEWVYNDADIDSSPVVWARDMGKAKNRELIDYFKHRRVWRLDVGRGSILFGPYTR